MIRPGSIAPYDVQPTAVRDPETDRYALIIGLGDLENQRIERLAEFVDRELATLDSAARLVGKCTLTVDGYNNDPRDLTHIPEVRTYFQKVAIQTPLLPFLLEPVRGECLLYMSLAGDARTVASGPEIQGDGEPLAFHAVSHFPQGHTLHKRVLDYAYALAEWLDKQGIVEDEAHPLWQAHERSIQSFHSVLKTMSPRVRVLH